MEAKKATVSFLRKEKLILEVTLAVWCVPHPNREGGLSQQAPSTRLALVFIPTSFSFKTFLRLVSYLSD